MPAGTITAGARLVRAPLPVPRGPLPMVARFCELCERPHTATPIAAARVLNCPFCGHRLPRRSTGAPS